MIEPSVRSLGVTGECCRNAVYLIVMCWHDWTDCSITCCDWGMLWKWCSLDSNILAWLNLVFNHLVWLGNVVEMLCIWFSYVGMIELTVQSPGMTGECCRHAMYFIFMCWHDWTDCSITWCDCGMLWKWCSLASNILAWLNLVFDHLVWLGNVVEMLCISFSCVGMIEQTVRSPGVTGECCGNGAVLILTYWHDWT
jgi:hypothetical protein